MIRDWLGIPEGYVGPRLSFDPKARIIVVELHSKSFGDGFLPTRLFMRHPEETEYRPVVAWDTNLSSESVVFAGDGVLAAFNSIRYTRIRDENVSGDWNGMFLWYMRENRVRCCANSDTLVIPSGFVRGWATALLGFSADAKQLYVHVGLQQENKRCQYYVAALNVATKVLELVSELKSTFF